MERIMEPGHPRDSAKGKELFLDTHGACFLCLQETSTSSSDDGGCREVCLRAICSKLRTVNLLRNNPCSVLLKSLKGSLLISEDEDTVNSQREKCDFSMMLCQTCANLTENLSQIIRQVEIARMILHHNLESFHKTLMGSEQKLGDAGHLWNKLKDKMLSSGANPVEARLVEYLRYETTKQCSNKVKTVISGSFPKVIVKRVKTDLNTDSCTPPIPEVINISSTKVESPIPASTNVAETYGGGTAGEPLISNPNNVPSITIHQEAQNNCPPTDIHVSLEIFSSHYKILETGDQHQCLYCNFTINSHSRLIGNHLCSNHPERIFMNYKLPQLSVATFTECSFEILMSEKQRAERRHQDMYPHQSCGYLCWDGCSRKFYTGNDFMVHLISEHPVILQENLISLQNTILSDNNGIPDATKLPDVGQCVEMNENDDLLLKDSSTVTDTSTSTCSPTADPGEPSNPTLSQYPTPNAKEFVRTVLSNHFQKHQNGYSRCLVCKMTYYPTKVRHHLVCMHPNKFFNHQRLEHVSERVFSDCCRQILRTTAGEATRVAKLNPGKPYKYTLQCSYCPLKYSDGQHLRFHLVMEHYNILEEKLIRLQQLQPSRLDSVRVPAAPSMGLPSSNCTSLIPDQHNWCIFYEHEDELPNNRNGRFRCKICSSVYNLTRIRQHLVIDHSEKLFADKKLDHLSEEIFKEHCAELLKLLTAQTRTRTTFSPKKGKVNRRKFLCPYCNSEYVDRDFLRYHLVTTHYSVLQDELEHLQKDGTLMSVKGPPHFQMSMESMQYRKRVCGTAVNNGCGRDSIITTTTVPTTTVGSNEYFPQAHDSNFHQPNGFCEIVDMNEQASVTQFIHPTDQICTNMPIYDIRLGNVERIEWDYQGNEMSVEEMNDGGNCDISSCSNDVATSQFRITQPSGANVIESEFGGVKGESIVPYL